LDERQTLLNRISEVTSENEAIKNRILQKQGDYEEKKNLYEEIEDLRIRCTELSKKMTECEQIRDRQKAEKELKSHQKNADNPSSVIQQTQDKNTPAESIPKVPVAEI